MPLRWTPDRCPVLVQFGTGQVLLLILRSTNTEPRALATGQTLAFRLLLAIGNYKHNCLPIRLNVRPVATLYMKGRPSGDSLELF